MPAEPRQSPPPTYLAPYIDAVDRHGATFEATLWNSREWQTRRFEVFVGAVDLAGKSIVDCGCGLADLASFLNDRGVKYGAYLGLEGVPELAAAAERRATPRVRILRCDFIADPVVFETAGSLLGAPADAIVFSGSLNTMDDATTRRALDRAWGALQTGGWLLFNFLSEKPGAPKEGCDSLGCARRHSARALVDWALDRTPHVLFRSDYLPGGHDATIVMRRV